MEAEFAGEVVNIVGNYLSNTAQNYLKNSQGTSQSWSQPSFNPYFTGKKIIYYKSTINTYFFHIHIIMNNILI